MKTLIYFYSILNKHPLIGHNMELTVYSSKTFNVGGVNSRTHKFNVQFTTWGPLKDFLYDQGIDTSGFKVIVAQTKNTLDSVEAVLPNIPAMTIMLSPTKVSSGQGDDIVAALDKIIEGFQELRDAIENQGVNTATASVAMSEEERRLQQEMEEIERTIE